jgi:putative ABC transport system ATP-binding protein
MIAVSARGITKSFGEGGALALKGVHVDVAQGECVMLVGPSGSGKTTLLSILGCVLRPTAGSYRLFGEEMSNWPEGDLPRVRRALIGFIFQGHNLIASMTALENVLFQLQMRGIDGKRAIAEAKRLLECVGLGEKFDNLPSQLSGGQRQRVAVARALAGEPPLILADEPTASLDLESGLAVMRLLKEVSGRGAHTLVIVTHDSRIFKFADRIEHLEDGLMVRKEEASIPDIRIAGFWAGGESR